MFKAPSFPLRVGNDIYFKPITVGQSLVKTADAQIDYAPEVSEFASGIKPRSGFMYVLINAVSAYEFWGCNINADAFKEEEFTVNERHKTFVTHGHPYRNHVNKDPNKSYGKVLFAAYNKRMHRVELICEYEISKAEDICERINRGEDVRVSMGCRVKHDICSICGHKSATTTDYCEHLKYEMKNIYPDGRVVCAFNPEPVFFDISVVWIPADKSARILYKVASPNGMIKRDGPDYSHVFTPDCIPSDFGFEEDKVFLKCAGADITRLAKLAVHNKRARISKEADIIKNIEAQSADEARPEDIDRLMRDSADSLRDNEETIPDELLEELVNGSSSQDVLKAMALMGMQPKADEFATIARPYISCPLIDELKEKDMLEDAIRHMLGGPMMDRAQVESRLVPSDLESSDIIESIIDKLKGFIRGKSYFAGPVTKRVIKITMIGMPKRAKVKKAFLGSMLAGAMGLGALGSLAASYLGSGLATGNMLGQPSSQDTIAAIMGSRPELAGPLLYGTSSMGAMMPGQPQLRASSFLNEADFYRAMVKSSFVKKATVVSDFGDTAKFVGKEIALPVLAPIMATHVMAGVFDAQDRKDMIEGRYNPNAIKDFIKNNPTGAGLVGSGLILSGKYNLFG